MMPLYMPRGTGNGDGVTASITPIPTRLAKGQWKKWCTGYGWPCILAYMESSRIEASITIDNRTKIFSMHRFIQPQSKAESPLKR